MTERSEQNFPKKHHQSQQNEQNQNRLEELLMSLQQQMNQMAGRMEEQAQRIQDLSRENKNLVDQNKALEGRLQYLDANTIADRAHQRIEATRAASKNKGQYAYYITIKDYALPIGPFFCDETDPVYVIARYERFYKTKFNPQKNELLTEREWLARNAS